MRSGKRYPVSPVLAGTPDAAATRHLGGPVGQGERGMHPPPRRWWPGVAWAGGGLALFAFFLRISLGSVVDSDGANNALQARDMLHGHLLLHGWAIGDATFYAFELPLNATTELLFGLGNLAIHAASALTYLIVAVLAAALAVTGSRGPARAALRGRSHAAGRAAAHQVIRDHAAGRSRPHRDLRVHAGALPADRPSSGPAVHGAAALRDPVRRPA